MPPSQTNTTSKLASLQRDWLSIALSLGGLLLLYYSIPLISLLLSVQPTTIFAELANPAVQRAIVTSVFGASLSTLLATVLGLPLAYWLARTKTIWQQVTLGFVVLPLVLPPTVSGVVLLTVIGPTTLLGDVASVSGVNLTRSLVGVVLAQTFVASPFVVVTAKAAIERVDETLEHASRALGKSRLQTTRKITLPLAGPGILAGVTLAFARAMGEFGATMMLAYYPRTMPVQIWVSFVSAGVERAYPVAIILLAVALISLIVLHTIAHNPWT